jgi:hypothetical protein
VLKVGVLKAQHGTMELDYRERLYMVLLCKYLNIRVVSTATVCQCIHNYVQ